jgi:glycosyltransferase involved in cell wall biosynthesis
MILTLPFIIVLAFAVLCLLILTYYYIYYFTQLKSVPSSEKQSSEPVSVIIAARNEIEDLKSNLPLILNQKYSIFEVIIVNDGSFDGTKDYLKELGETNERLKIVTLELDERYHRGKKFALTMGIKAASYERLLFTDADCYPASEFWIQKMMNASIGKEIVLGISPLRTTKSLLGALIRFETFHTSLQYTTYAMRGNAYMGVGRNLSYTKSLFFKNKGFASHQHLLSGDDDLFVQEAATRNNVAVCIDDDSITYSKGETTWGKWFKQKKRHLSTGKLYQSGIKRKLSIYSLAQLFFYISLPALVILDIKLWYIAVGLLLLKWLLQWLVMYKPSQLLKARQVGYMLPVFDILYTFYLTLFGILKPFTRVDKWN